MSKTRLAAVAYCPHGAMYAAHTITERTSEEEAIEWINARPQDIVAVVPVGAVRLGMGDCDEGCFRGETVV